jgi:hypothetical protein
MLAGLRVESGGITADFDGIKVKSNGMTVYQGGARLQTNESGTPALFVQANDANFTSSVMLVSTVHHHRRLLSSSQHRH